MEVGKSIYEFKVIFFLIGGLGRFFFYSVWSVSVGLGFGLVCCTGSVFQGFGRGFALLPKNAPRG